MLNFLFVIIFIIFFSCAPAVNLAITPEAPNRPDVAVNYKALKMIKSIAVLPFVNSVKKEGNLLPSPPFHENTNEKSFPYQNDGEVISDAIAKELIRSFKYKIIDRENVEAILKEQAFQLSGAVDDVTAVKAGEIAGVDAIVVGKVNLCFYGKQWKAYAGSYAFQEIAYANISFKLLNVISGETIMMFSHEINAKNLMSNQVVINNDKVLEDLSYYKKDIPDMDMVIRRIAEIAVQEIVNPKE